MAVGMVLASGGVVTATEGMIQLGWLEEGDCLCVADQRARSEQKAALIRHVGCPCERKPSSLLGQECA
jgi:hypothetical protein